MGGFKRQLKKLSKNRHGLAADYEAFVANLEATRESWRRVQDVDGAPVWITRMSDSSSDRGKSGGFRVHLFVSATKIYLLHIQLRRDAKPVPGALLLRTLKAVGLWPPAEG